MDISSAFNLIQGALSCYSEYKKIPSKPKLALEIRHVDWQTKTYDRSMNLISGIWECAQTGFGAGIGASVLGMSSVLGIVGVDTVITNKIPSKFAYGLLNDINNLLVNGKVYEHYKLQEKLGLLKNSTILSNYEQKGYLHAFAKGCVAVGAAVACYKGCELIVKSALNRPREVPQPIFNEELNADIMDLAVSTCHTGQEGAFFQNVLFYGPGGTGKTMLSKWIAENSNMNYIMMSASDLIQYIKTGEHISELNNLFETAKNYSSPTIIFIDEAESICRSREKLNRPELVELQAALLSQTGEPSKKVMIILATNRLEDFDVAILNRIDHKMFIGLPKIQEREKIIRTYLSRFFNEKEIQEFFNEEKIAEMAQKTEGLSGRSLFKMVNHLLGLKTQQHSLTSSMINLAINRFVSREKQADQTKSK